MWFEGGTSFIIPDDMLFQMTFLERKISKCFCLPWIDPDCLFFLPQPSIVVYRLCGVPSYLCFLRRHRIFLFAWISIIFFSLKSNSADLSSLLKLILPLMLFHLIFQWLWTSLGHSLFSYALVMVCVPNSVTCSGAICL